MERVSELPPALLANLSDTAKTDMERWTVTRPVMLKMSKEMYYVRHGETPLFVAGAMQLGLFNNTRELWLYSSRFLRGAQLRCLQQMFLEWKAVQPGTLYARTDQVYKGRFLRFFGFRLVNVEGGIELYEVIP